VGTRVGIMRIGLIMPVCTKRKFRPMCILHAAKQSTWRFSSSKAPTPEYYFITTCMLGHSVRRSLEFPWRCRPGLYQVQTLVFVLLFHIYSIN